MTEHRRIETFRIEIPRGFAYRLLGFKKTGRRPRGSVMSMIDQEFATAAELVDPRAVMRLGHGGLPGSDFVEPDMPLVAVVCTIGAALEERVSELSERGEAARAAILDAIGSAAAEEVADRSNRLICEMAAPTDYRPDARRSPGYGDWDIREQAAIFSFLEPEDIGVGLNEHCMMVPRKSVSFAVPLEGGTPGQGPGNRCSRCGAADCPYRRLLPVPLRFRPT